MLLLQDVDLRLSSSRIPSFEPGQGYAHLIFKIFIGLYTLMIDLKMQPQFTKLTELSTTSTP